MDRLSELLGSYVQFQYTALDRIVLNGYIERLQRPEGLVYFLHDVAGVPCIEPSVLTRRTDEYRAWVRRFAQERQVPLLAAVKGERKEDVVQPHYRRLKGEEGVACVLTNMEQGRTFVSYTPKEAKGDPNYRYISTARKRFMHYYFYIWDPVMGPMSLRVATYLPFNLTFYLNGHSFLGQELGRLGIANRKEDNAFLAVADVSALQAAAVRLTPELLQARCDYWAGQLAPSFSEQESLAFAPSYRYSISQIELATDVVFRRSAPLRAWFERAAELGLLLGGADRATYLFGRRITRRFNGRLQTVLEARNQGHPVLRSYYRSSFVRQYEKADRLLRTETCINDTYHLGIGRRLENLPTLLERMTQTNQRYLDLQSELLDSTVDQGQLAELARPTLVGHRRIPGIKLHDDRVLRLMEALLHPGSFLADWTTRETYARLIARHRLSESDYRLTQMRYDLLKLRAKGLVERIGNSRRYKLTPLGIKLGTLLTKLRTRLLGPILSLKAHQTPRTSNNPSKIESALRDVQSAFDRLYQTLGLKAA